MKYTDLINQDKFSGLNEHLQNVYKIIARDSGELDVAHSIPIKKNALGIRIQDDKISPVSHSIDSVREIQEELYKYYQDMLPKDYQFTNVDEYSSSIRKKATEFLQVSHAVRDSVNDKQEVVKIIDSWFNSQTGIGTSSDPGFYNTADIPIQISPQQATAYYASGGIPKVIIDKKVNGPFINGYYFEGDFTAKELKEFKKHYHKLGLESALKKGLRDSLIYGGASIIPHFKQDNNLVNYSRDLSMMGSLGKKEIDRFWTADRWNMVMIPDTNIEHQDYFYPPYFYIPMAGVEVATERMAIIRINELPFWGAIVQIGWGVSDMESWMKSVLSYNIMMSSLPVMGQQISLVYQHIPADPIIFASGPQVFEEWAEANSAQLALWDVTHPKTFNSYGEIKTLERNYTGYPELVNLLQENIGAESTIPASSIFHKESKGFNDNTEDVTVKESAAYKHISNIFCQQCDPLIYTLGLDYFGASKKDKIRTLRLCLDSNTIITNEQKASLGMNFFNMLQIGSGAGIPADISGKIAGKFISGVQIDDEIIKLLEEGQQEADKKEEKDRKASSQKTGLFGMGGPKKTNASGTPARASIKPGSRNDQKSGVRKASGKGRK